jgi:hypothetical protein
VKIDTFYHQIGRRRTRVVWAGFLLALVILLGGAISSRGQAVRPSSEQYPELIVDDSVANDFRAVATEAWVKFLIVFAARRDCFGDVRLRATRQLASRAAYDPATATVTVRVPATAAMLQGALVHEWAHHLEFQCEAHQDFRAAFLLAQGLPPDTLWRPDYSPANTLQGAWNHIPSEQYAEAAIELVLGRRQIPTGVHLRPEAVQVLAAWAAADDYRP